MLSGAGKREGLEDVVDHYQSVVQDLDQPPIIMGHSFGGLITQVLLDRGLGAAGVAIDSAPVKGILLLPFSTLRVGFPVLRNPANLHRAGALSPEQFHYAFGNNLTEGESLQAYERYAVPGPDHILFQGAFANFNPHSPTTVNFAPRSAFWAGNGGSLSYVDLDARMSVGFAMNEWMRGEHENDRWLRLLWAVAEGLWGARY